MGSRINATTLWGTAQTINATAAITSPAIDMRESLGDALALDLTLAGSSVSVDVTIGVSNDGVTFKTPYDSTGDISAVITTLTASQWYQFVPPIAPYIQITITGDGSNGADTTALGTLIRQTDN